MGIKKFFLFVIALFLTLIFGLLFLFRWRNSSTDKELDFKVIMSKNVSVIGIPAQEIIFRDKKTWNEFWAQYDQDIPSTIDFKKYIAVGIFEGGRSNSGYGIEVTKVYETKSSVQVDTTKYVPNRKHNYLTMMVYPFQIIYFRKTNKEITFNRATKVSR